jgi:hypothetical protein
VTLSADSITRARTAYRLIEREALGPTSERDEAEIVAALQGLTPEERGEAVRLINSGSDPVTTDHLLTDDIDDPALRTTAAQLIRDADTFAHRPGPSIISDVDKTILDGAGHRYPGVRALYEALGSNEGGNMHVVSARPLSFLLPTEYELHEMPHNSVSYGRTVPSFFSLFGSFDGIMKEKVRDCLAVFARNPERTFTLVGDTAQSDPAVYRDVLRQRPGQVRLVLIHEVDGRSAPADLAADPRVVCFSDYADAARKLKDRGDLTQQQLDAVLADHTAGV